jgi:hypothetical protein
MSWRNRLSVRARLPIQCAPAPGRVGSSRETLKRREHRHGVRAVSLDACSFIIQVNGMSYLACFWEAKPTRASKGGSFAPALEQECIRSKVCNADFRILSGLATFLGKRAAPVLELEPVGLV